MALSFAVTITYLMIASSVPWVRSACAERLLELQAVIGGARRLIAAGRLPVCGR